jgi:uncharacterized protein (TIGR04255 family)
MARTTRPVDLPEYMDPPLNEVLLGVQFTPPVGYHQLLAGDVWRLFKSRYPNSSELPPLPPSYETFGPPGVQQFQFNLSPGGQHNRYWFITADQTELLQFQNDRFMHNWRKIEGVKAEYPRFDTLLDRFQDELTKLSEFFRGLPGNGRQLVCTQAELSYVNHISLPKGSAIDPSPFLKFLQFAGLAPDDMTMTWRRALKNSNGSPYARLICETTSAINAKSENILVFNLTIRGNPSVGTIGNIMEFLRSGRDMLVAEFDKLTTEEAHRRWERT